jgi:hypothetical protein
VELLGLGAGHEFDRTLEPEPLLPDEADELARGEGIGSALDADLDDRLLGDPWLVLQEPLVDRAELLDVELAKRDPLLSDTASRRCRGEIEEERRHRPVVELGGFQDPSGRRGRVEELTATGGDRIEPLDPGEPVPVDGEEGEHALPQTVTVPSRRLVGRAHLADEGIEGVRLFIEGVGEEAGVPGLGVENEEEPVEAGEGGVAERGEVVVSAPTVGVAEGLDEALRGLEDGALQIIGDAFGVLATLPLDDVDGEPTVLAGREGLGSEEAQRRGEGFPVLGLEALGDAQLEVGTPGPLAGPADEADPLTGDEEAVAKVRLALGQGRGEPLGGRRPPIAPGVQVLVEAADVGEEER